MKEFFTIKETITDLHEKVEMEAGSITQDQKYFADYLHGVKNFKPWMDNAETVAKTPLVKPAKIEDALALLETVKVSPVRACLMRCTFERRVFSNHDYFNVLEMGSSIKTMHFIAKRHLSLDISK